MNKSYNENSGNCEKQNESLLEALRIKEEGISKAFALVEEAKEFQLLSSDCYPQNIEEAITYLHKIAQWEGTFAEVIPKDEQLNALQEKRRELDSQLQEKNAEISATEAFAKEAEGYTTESRQQELRLESLNLFFQGEHATEMCPVCLQKMPHPTPTTHEIQTSLQQLRDHLETTTREKPKLRAYINRLKDEATTIKREIERINNAINASLTDGNYFG